MIDFSDEQQDYLGSSLERNIYLRACPGAGKTEVIAAKVALEVRRWQNFPAGIAVLSFSRSATSEIDERIAKVRRGNTNSYPHFIGTVDSFILKHIVTPLAHLVTGYAGRDGDYALKVVGPEARSLYRARYSIEHQPIFANRYDWDKVDGKYRFWHPVDTVKLKLNKVVLADWQIKDLDSAKKRFNANGFATYKDVERMAIAILSDARFKVRVALLVARFPMIIIDECQDLSAEQIAIFTYLADLGVRFHLVGDLDQAIYEFRNCFPAAVKEFIARIRCEEMPLTKNWRSGQSIVDLHGKLVNSGKTKGKANYAPVTCYLLEYIKCPSEVLTQFDALSAGHREAVIVARGHSTLSKLRSADAELGPAQLLAAAIAAYVKDAPGTLHLALSTFARYLAESCMDCDTLGEDMFFRPLDFESAETWHMFLSDCLSVLVNVGLDDQDLTWKQWCKQLRDVLPNLAPVDCSEVVGQQILANLKAKKHPSPAGLGDAKVIFRPPKAPVLGGTRRLATIHEVKGETHDLTMLVSSMKQGEASHWKEWIADPQSEAARLAYVASSRPRHVLIWAVKAVGASDRKKLIALGFQTYPV